MKLDREAIVLWTNKTRARGAAAAALLMLSGAAIAAPLVVRSTGPSAKLYPAGKAIPDTAKIVLKAGDSIVLLDGHGTRTISGPGTFSATASATAAATTGSTLAQLASAGGERRARIGAVRSASGIDTSGRNPSVWYIDLDRSTTMCVADTTNLTVWRKDATAPATIAVSGPGGNGTIAFAAGQTAASWPTGLTVTTGAQYKLSHDGAKAPTALKFVVVKAASPGLEDMAQSLIQAGCTAQVDLLIQTVALPGEKPKG